MELRIFAKSVDIDARSEDYIQKKFSRLERHLPNLSDAKLEVDRTSSRSRSDRIVAQLTLSAGGRVLRGQERGPNLFAAVDSVTDVVDRQIRRYKGKFYRSEQTRRAARTELPDEAEPVAEDATAADAQAHEEGPPQVVRAKRFPMRPMAVEDATIEMELLSHSFYMFYNIESNGYNVVYRRHDGEYGVIEPTLT